MPRARVARPVLRGARGWVQRRWDWALECGGRHASPVEHVRLPAGLKLAPSGLLPVLPTLEVVLPTLDIRGGTRGTWGGILGPRDRWAWLGVAQ